MTAIKAGKYRAKSTGFLFDRLHNEGKPVTISQAFLDEHKEKTGKDFTASWLELVELSERQPAPVDDEQVLREVEEAKLRDELESLGVEVDKRWGVKRLKEELNLAHERAAL